MKQAVVGIFAHVDAGKTTLAEAMLFASGAIRHAGRVDHGDAHLDSDSIEQVRGITIFSSQGVFDYAGVHFMLIDTPGHVDFSAEAERALSVLDYAILVIDGTRGVQSHTKTLWRLLTRYGVPVFVFVNKMDVAEASAEAALLSLQASLDGYFATVGFAKDWSSLDDGAQEQFALADEEILDAYMETGQLTLATARCLVAQRKVVPCFSGSALRSEGIETFLHGMAALVLEKEWPEAFGAQIFKITHDERGTRLVWLKVTGGELHAKMTLSGTDAKGEPWSEKVEQIRICNGAKFESTSNVSAGQICVVMGLSHCVAGEALGVQAPGLQPQLASVLTYGVSCEGVDIHTAYKSLELLAQEDPALNIAWNSETQEIQMRLMGVIQLEVLQDTIQRRFGFAVRFDQGRILYKETITAPTRGIGHFEPLRHYAEVQYLLEPLPAGSGVRFGTVCDVDSLDLNWQRLTLTNAMERDIKGVLAGYPVTDVRVTLLIGRAHLKHTEGGDFRQATYRALRQALMQARERGNCQLLEPYFDFELLVPEDKIGRALSDCQRMSARFEAPSIKDGWATVEGAVPASEVQDYPLQVAAYTSGQGSFSCSFAGYEPCHNASSVIEAAAYDPEADLDHTPDSVFCAHGAGYTVKWFDASEAAHTVFDENAAIAWRAANREFFGK